MIHPKKQIGIIPTHNPKSLRSETTLMPWLIWFVAVLFYAYEFTQRVSLNIYWPFLSKEFLASTAAIGLMNSCFYWAYALMQIPAGILIDRLGTKRLATAGILLVSIGSLYFSMTHSIFNASIARLVIGVGASVAFICVMKLIIIWFPPYRFALVAGLTNLAGYIGASIGQVPLNMTVNRFGWHVASQALTVVGFIIAALLIIYVKDKPYNKHKKSNKPTKLTPPSIFTGLKKITSKPMNWANGAYAMLMMGPTSVFGALWGKSFLTNADHFSGNIAAGAITTIFIGVAVGSPFFGWLTEYTGKRQRLLVTAAIGALCSTLTLIYFNHIGLIVAYGCCFLFGFCQSAHVINFAIAKGINAKKNSGAAMGFTNMAAVLGGAWLLPLVGYILEFSTKVHAHGDGVFAATNYHAALVFIPACQLLAVIISWRFLKDDKQDELAKKAYRVAPRFVY